MTHLREAAQTQLAAHRQEADYEHHVYVCKCGHAWPCPGREFALLVLNTLDQSREITVYDQGMGFEKGRFLPDPVAAATPLEAKFNATGGSDQTGKGISIERLSDD